VVDKIFTVGLVRRVEISVGGVTTGVQERQGDKTAIRWAETNERGHGQVEEGKPVETRSMGENGECGAEMRRQGYSHRDVRAPAKPVEAIHPAGATQREPRGPRDG
jgi:hypothetical protein